MASGDLLLSWHRRPRKDADWGLGAVPLDTAVESYEVDIHDGPTVKRTLTSSTDSVTYSAANQVTDFGANQALVSFKVYQIGDDGRRGYPGEFMLPYLLPGLVLAYEPTVMLPSVGDNAALPKWFDLGPRQAHLAEATNPPTFQTNEQNNLPIVEFDGSNDSLSTALAPITGGMARTLYAVVKRDSAASDLVPLINLNHANSFAAGTAFIVTPDPTVRVESGNRIWTPSSDLGWHVIAVRMPAGGRTDELQAWRDGSLLSVGSTSSRAINTGANGVAIGRRNDISVSLDGMVGDIYCYAAYHSDVQVGLMMRHLKSRWATP